MFFTTPLAGNLLTGRTGMCMYRTWPVDALRRQWRTDGLSLVCSSMVRNMCCCCWWWWWWWWWWCLVANAAVLEHIFRIFMHCIDKKIKHQSINEKNYWTDYRKAVAFRFATPANKTLPLYNYLLSFLYLLLFVCLFSYACYRGVLERRKW